MPSKSETTFPNRLTTNQADILKSFDESRQGDLSDNDVPVPMNNPIPIEDRPSYPETQEQIDALDLLVKQFQHRYGIYNRETAEVAILHALHSDDLWAKLDFSFGTGQVFPENAKSYQLDRNIEEAPPSSGIVMIDTTG